MKHSALTAVKYKFRYKYKNTGNKNCAVHGVVHSAVKYKYKYKYKNTEKKNCAVHGVVLSAVKYKWFNPQVAFLQRPPSRNLNKIKENKRQRGSSEE